MIVQIERIGVRLPPGQDVSGACSIKFTNAQGDILYKTKMPGEVVRQRIVVSESGKLPAQHGGASVVWPLEEQFRFEVNGDIAGSQVTSDTEEPNHIKNVGSSSGSGSSSIFGREPSRRWFIVATVTIGAKEIGNCRVGIRFHSGSGDDDGVVEMTGKRKDLIIDEDRTGSASAIRNSGGGGRQSAVMYNGQNSGSSRRVFRRKYALCSADECVIHHSGKVGPLFSLDLT